MYRECQRSNWCNSSLYYFPEKGREDSSSGLYGNRWQRWGQVHRGNGMREPDASHPDLMRLLQLMNNWTKDLAASTLNEILYTLYKSKKWCAFIAKCLRLHPNQQESLLDVLNLCLQWALQLNLTEVFFLMNCMNSDFFAKIKVKYVLFMCFAGQHCFLWKSTETQLNQWWLFTPQQLATCSTRHHTTRWTNAGL